MSEESKWIALGKSTVNADWLRSVTEQEAIEHFEGTAVHADRVRNAWKQANGHKTANRKKDKGVVVTPRNRKK